MDSYSANAWKLTSPFKLYIFLEELERRTGIKPTMERIMGVDSINIPIEDTQSVFFVLCFDSVKRYFECSLGMGYIYIVNKSAADKYFYQQVKQTLKTMGFPLIDDKYKEGMKRGEVEDVYWFYHHPPKWTNKKWEEIRWWEFVKP